MNKNIFITLLVSLLLLSGCTGDTCIDPDDFGFIKFNVSSRYNPEEITSRDEGDQVVPWRDSAYKVNGYPLTVMVRPWSYILGDKNTSGQLSAWCPWYGQKNNTTTLAAFCVKLQPCTFWDNARLDMCTPNPANQSDAMISNPPCIMTDGVGLYFLIAAKNTDPNISPDSQRKPQGITQHLGELTSSVGYEFYSVSSTGQFLKAGGINYQYKGQEKSKYAQSPLYFKIIDKFYNDNSGQYRLVIKSGVTDTRPDPLQFLTDLIKRVLFGKDGIIKKTYQQIIDTPGYRMSVSAILTLYIMFTGFSFLIGNINLTHVELIVRILKVSIVSILLSTDKAWTFFHDYLFVFFIDGVQQILQIINEAAATGPGSQSLLGLLIAPQTLSKLFSLLFVDWLGFIYIILYLIALYFLFFLIFKATIIYLTALITIGMIIIMGPIFICFMLFNITRSLFENWLRQLISYALQPIILFAGIAFISMIIRTEIYSTLGFGVCKHDFPNLGPINEIFGSFLEDIDPSLGNSIFYWWFPVPMKGGINNFHKAKILVPGDHIIVDDTCKNDHDKCKHCAAYECIDERYIELPFLDLVKDAKRISNFINGKFVQLDGILLIFVSIYLLSKFNDTAISTAQFISGTSGNLTDIQKVNQQSYEYAAKQMNRPLSYVAKMVGAPVTSRVNAMQEQASMFFAEKFENMMMGRLEKQALGSSANKAVQNEVKRKYGIDFKDVKMNAITDYENGISGLLKNLPKGNELKAKELSKMKFTQLRDKIAANKYGVKDYTALSKEQKTELDKSLKDANLRELASDANFTKDYQDAYKYAHQEMSGRGVGLFGKNIGVLRIWQEMEHRVDTKRKLKEEKRVGIGEKIYAGYTGIKRGALTAIVGKDLRDAYEGNLTSAEWHDFEYNDPRLRTYSEKLKDNDKAREREELKMHINKETLAAQADILSPEYLARLEKAGRQSDVEYYQELAYRKLMHDVHGMLFEEGKPVMMGDRFMREKATDSQMRDMIDNAHRKHAEFIEGDRYIRRQEHYDIMHEKAEGNLEQTYKELKDHFKRDQINIEEIPELIAQKIKDTEQGPEVDAKITEELNNFNADVKNYEYSTEVLNKIEDRKQAITDEVNAQIDQINKYRENAKMEKYVRPIVNEGRKLRKLEDHLRNMN
ncbi:TrbL/VirB6 plasmid Conjugative transfer protein [Rickettsia akari str. Hartford]|uniref:TrbL/VirB6 plasmid Conjugative transfer protein n=1 Tax=Rickettsia akari (strain Hartford) TaxID=293614 RepID=A8GM67_RICAH|nr:type IV secretion system protein [Rickettsia akari]ABV74492.1 TrbL/VirB6 plasmid Conjugative transfer protein [Rickettsia akari str. Hartford]